MLGDFDISKIDKLPKVGIVYGYAGVDETAVKGYINAGYRGIVYAGVGDGNLSGKMLGYLSSIVKKGIAVVRSSRVLSGGTMSDGEVDDKQYGFYAGGRISPQKCRILLMLCMANNQSYLIL
jgi:L-asparaginase